MIASLPMYDWPEVREATDAWWRGLARHAGADLPLARLPDHTAAWSDPSLLLSQTCGYPFTHKFAGQLTLVATPHYGIDGCDGPNYQSIIFARAAGDLESLRGARAAVNNPDSMSGMLALKLAFAPLARDGAFFSRVHWSGGHVSSLRAVRDGLADVCATDAVCVALARRYRPDYLQGLVEVARSPMVPGLPYVTRAGDVPGLRQALTRALTDPELQDARDHLFLTGFSALDAQDYKLILELEDAIEKAGGLDLP